MQKPALLVALLLSIAWPAAAANWVVVVKGINQSTSYIDTDSIERHGRQVTVWSRHLLDTPLPLPGAPGKFDEMRIKQTIDCQARTSAHLLVRLYNRGKEVMAEAAHPPRAKPILPGGISDHTRQTVCQSM